jgi:hypothetical protein
MAPFSQARQILAHARELTLRKRGTQRPPVTLLSLVDGEFPKAPSPLAPRSEAPPPRGASTFWKTHNSATRTRLRPFYLWTGDDPIRIEPRFPPPRSSAYPRRRAPSKASTRRSSAPRPRPRSSPPVSFTASRRSHRPPRPGRKESPTIWRSWPVPLGPPGSIPT